LKRPWSWWVTTLKTMAGLAFGVMPALAMSALRLAVERDPDLPRRRTA
jgi:hypothetical protein